MKRKSLMFILLTLTLIVTALLCLSGCKGEEKPELIQLDTPTVTVDSDGNASWDAVANASMYVYKIDDGEEFATTKLSVKLEHKQRIRVKAVGDRSKYVDSEFSLPKVYIYSGGSDPVTSETSIKLNGYTLSWSKFNNAIGYRVTVEGRLFDVKEGTAKDNTYTTHVLDCSLDLCSVLSPATQYKVTVTSTVTEGEESSENATVTTEKVTAGLSYTLNDDRMSYTVDRGGASKSGRIVLPDVYNGKPVTKIAEGAFGTESVPPVPNKVTSIRLPLGLLEIGDSAFRNCDISEVKFSTTLKKIGKTAFYCCSKITELVFPEGLKEIGETSFRAVNCTDLILPESLNVIGPFAFVGSAVTTLTAGNNLQEIGNSAFKDTPWFENQPEGMIYIGNVLYAYTGEMSEGTELTISQDTTVLAMRLFADRTELKSVRFLGNVKTIPASCFANCTNLQSVYFPDSVTEIGTNAFLGCESLTTVSSLFGITTLGDYAFSQSGLTSFVVPEGVTTISAGCFSKCSDLSSFTVGKNVTAIERYAFQTCVSLTSFTIPYGVKTIGKNAFTACSNMKTLIISSTVTAIDGFAFSGCAFEEIELPSGLTTMGNSVFYGCSSLKRVTLPERITVVPDSTFFNNTAMEEISLPYVTEIGNKAFQGCSMLIAVTLSDELAKIGQKAFYGCVSLAGINIPDTLVELGAEAFYGCKALAGTVSLKNVTVIGESTFEGCEAVTDVVLGDIITRVGQKAFYGCIALEEINTPAELTFIGIQAFYGCKSLSTFYFSDKLKTVENEGFSGCEGLKIVVNDSVAVLYPGVFKNCKSLESFKVNDGVGYIMSEVFYGCSSLKYLELPSGMVSLYDSLTGVNEDLVIYYHGSATNTLKYKVVGDNTWYTTTWGQAGAIGLTVYFYSATEPTADGNYWHYDNNGKIIVWVKND